MVVVLMRVHLGSRRARGRRCAAGPRWWSGGLLALAARALGGVVAGLTGGRLAAGEELDPLSHDVDPGGIRAVLGLELVEQQPPVDGDLASRLEVLRARRRLRVKALDVEVAVLALLAGALDRDPQRADRLAAVGLQELRVLGQMAGAGPAVHDAPPCPSFGGGWGD